MYSIRIKNPPFIMLGSDYSQQEPKMLAFVSSDPSMITAFKHDKDIYATIAALSFNMPYEKCLEFNPETHDYQPDGKQRRTNAKSIVLGITYGRSTKTIGDQLFGGDKTLTDQDKMNRAQKIYDAVLTAFPNLRAVMFKAQNDARTRGYTETILGRRRHIPDMQLPEYEFKPAPGYVNPDIDPLDPSTLHNKNQIPERIVQQLQKEYAGYKYKGQIYKRNEELSEQHIKVINNSNRIRKASRECLNSIIQGSASELTKMAILRLINDPRWLSIGGRLLIPVHDELICEVPIQYWEEGSHILAEDMSKAGDFLPFTISTDVEVSMRWYGLSYPCPYSEPESLDNLAEDNIKWIQYCLTEMEYILPVFNDENGEKPRGDAAKGVNGVQTEELTNAIIDYIDKYHIEKNQFISHIKNKVFRGI